jgi:hypothetical protein
MSQTWSLLLAILAKEIILSYILPEHVDQKLKAEKLFVDVRYRGYTSARKLLFTWKRVSIYSCEIRELGE